MAWSRSERSARNSRQTSGGRVPPFRSSAEPPFKDILSVFGVKVVWSQAFQLRHDVNVGVLLVDKLAQDWEEVLLDFGYAFIQTVLFFAKRNVMISITYPSPVSSIPS